MSEVPLYALQTELSSWPRLRFFFCSWPSCLPQTIKTDSLQFFLTFFCFEFMLFFSSFGAGVISKAPWASWPLWTVDKVCLECDCNRIGYEELTAHRPARFSRLSLPLHYSTPMSLLASSSHSFFVWQWLGGPVALWALHVSEDKPLTCVLFNLFLPRVAATDVLKVLWMDEWTVQCRSAKD